MDLAAIGGRTGGRTGGRRGGRGRDIIIFLLSLF